MHGRSGLMPHDVLRRRHLPERGLAERRVQPCLDARQIVSAEEQPRALTRFDRLEPGAKRPALRFPGAGGYAVDLDVSVKALVCSAVRSILLLLEREIILPVATHHPGVATDGDPDLSLHLRFGDLQLLDLAERGTVEVGARVPNYAAPAVLEPGEVEHHAAAALGDVLLYRGLLFLLPHHEGQVTLAACEYVGRIPGIDAAVQGERVFLKLRSGRTFCRGRSCQHCKLLEDLVGVARLDRCDCRGGRRAADLFQRLCPEAGFDAAGEYLP